MAEDTEQDQKTEAPTGKRLDEARNRGQLPLSREMAIFISLVAMMISLKYFGPPLVAHMIEHLRFFIEMPHTVNLEGDNLQSILIATTLDMGAMVFCIFLLMTVANILGTMLQTDFFIGLQMLKMNFEALTFVGGFSRIFSLNAIFELAKNIVKLLVLGSIALSMMLPLINELPYYTGKNLVDVAAFLHEQVYHILINLMLVLAVLAFVDWVYQRFQYFKKLRMTKTEVKDEFKQQEGDPVIKGRLRQIRLDKARKRMMAQVPKADVVVTNPTHYAVALQYDSAKMNAPVVLAKGVDFLAQRIREIAEEHKVPLVSNPPLARTLYDTVDVDHAIKAEHYRAVAEVISFVYKLKKKRV